MPYTSYWTQFATLLADLKATLVSRGQPWVAQQEATLEQVCYQALRSDDAEAYVTAWINARYPEPEE